MVSDPRDANYKNYTQILKKSGLGTLAEVISSAGKRKAKSRAKYEPKSRITKKQAAEFENILTQKKKSNELISGIERKHADVIDDPLSFTGAVGWAGEEAIPVPLIGLELQKLSLDLLQTTDPQQIDSIRARMKELEHLLDTLKKGK